VIEWVTYGSVEEEKEAIGGATQEASELAFLKPAVHAHSCKRNEIVKTLEFQKKSQ
jgi:hypothetical protein